MAFQTEIIPEAFSLDSVVFVLPKVSHMEGIMAESDLIPTNTITPEVAGSEIYDQYCIGSFFGERRSPNLMMIISSTT